MLRHQKKQVVIFINENLPDDMELRELEIEDKWKIVLLSYESTESKNKKSKNIS